MPFGAYPERDVFGAQQRVSYQIGPVCLERVTQSPPLHSALASAGRRVSDGLLYITLLRLNPILDVFKFLA